MQQFLEDAGIGDLIDPAQEEGLQRNVFPWIGFDDPFKEVQSKLPGHKTITAYEIVTKHGVPRQELQRYIRSEIDEAEMFRSLPSTFVFVMTYAIMCMVHIDAVAVRSVESSIREAIEHEAKWAFDGPDVGHKTLDDVNSIAGFWSWTKKGLIPLLNRQETTVSEKWNVSEPYTAQQVHDVSMTDRGILLSYNRIMSGIRFTLQKSQPVECKSSKTLKKFWNRPCYGRAYEVDPETWTGRARAFKDNVTWFYTFEDVAVMQDRLFRMEVEGWLDESTEKVEIAIPLYNAEIGLHTLFTINCFFSRGGSMWKQMLPLSSFAVWWTYYIYMVYDMIWFIGLFFIIRNELGEIMWYCKYKRCIDIWEEYVGFWNMVDWASVIMGLAIVVLTGRCWVEMSDCNHYMALVPIWTDPNFPDAVDAYMKALESVVDYVSRLNLVFACYPMIIIFRLFKAFSAQPRLAIVTETLYVTGIDLLHFLLVFASVFVTLGISGLVLFGRAMSSFTTFPRALNTVFRIMLLDFDWETFGKHGVSRTESGIFLIVTVLLLNLVFLNMTLSIVMDGYKIVKKTAFSGDTLFTEVLQLWTRTFNVRRGIWVTLDVVQTALLALEAAGRHKTNESKSAKRSGRMKAKADGHTTVLVGRDCKCQPGTRVTPSDPDIEHFVGNGTVELVSVHGDRARVRHEGTEGIEGAEGAHVRDYDIGHDLNFELKLMPGEDIIEIDHDADSINPMNEVISPARLMKVVRESNPKVWMGQSQALSLCMDCVDHYYKAHCEDVDQDQLLQLMRKVRFRIKKIGELIIDGSCQALGGSIIEDLPRLRAALSKFYKTVDEERQCTHALIHEAETEIASLHMQLENKHPEQHAAHFFDVRQVQHEVHHESTATVSSRENIRTSTRRQPGQMSDRKSPRKDIASIMDREASYSMHEDTWDTMEDEALFEEVDNLLKESAELHRAGGQQNTLLQAIPEMGPPVSSRSSGRRRSAESNGRERPRRRRDDDERRAYSDDGRASSLHMSDISLEDSESGAGSMISSYGGSQYRNGNGRK